MRPGQRYHHFSADVMAQARRRRLKRVVVAIVLGLVLAAYTYGALDQRATDRDDLLPEWGEALLLGGAFAIASMPVAWSILGRALIPIPTLFLYLSVFVGKDPPLPFAAAFVLALIYCGGLTTLTAFLGDRPDRPRLGLRR